MSKKSNKQPYVLSYRPASIKCFTHGNKCISHSWLQKLQSMHKDACTPQDSTKQPVIFRGPFWHLLHLKIWPHQLHKEDQTTFLPKAYGLRENESRLIQVISGQHCTQYQVGFYLEVASPHIKAISHLNQHSTQKMCRTREQESVKPERLFVVLLSLLNHSNCWFKNALTVSQNS